MSPQPDQRDEDFDARFAEIVAHWDAEAPDQPASAAPSHPAAPERPEPAPAPRDEARPDPVETGWRSYEPPADTEEFVPPAPAPLPRVRRDPWFWVSLVGIVGGGLLLLGVAIFAPDSAGRLATGALVAFVVGFAALVVRHTSGPGGDREGWEDDSGTRL